MNDNDFTDDSRDQEWLRQQFEFEACAECGWDADQHTVGPDPLGLRHAWCNDPLWDGLPGDQLSAELARRLALSTNGVRVAITWHRVNEDGISVESLPAESVIHSGGDIARLDHRTAMRLSDDTLFYRTETLADPPRPGETWTPVEHPGDRFEVLSADPDYHYLRNAVTGEVRRVHPSHFVEGEWVRWWTEREPTGPQDDGGVGGDIQVGTAWNRSWLRPTPGAPGFWSVLSSTYYVAADPPKTGERFIQQQLGWLVCTDPTDPGNSEWWADYEYDDLSDTRPATDELAHEFSAKETAEELGWDGREGFEDGRNNAGIQSGGNPGCAGFG